METTHERRDRGEQDATRVETKRVERHRDAAAEAAMHVRAADMEPYVGLRYVAKLFRIIALILLMLLIAEVSIGFYQQGMQALPTLLAIGSRLLVLAGLLWGGGDIAILLIDIGHDVRATRILAGRQAAHHIAQHHPVEHEAPAGQP